MKTGPTLEGAHVVAILKRCIHPAGGLGGRLGLQSNGEDDPYVEQTFRDLWEDETQREIVLESLRADCEVRTGRSPDL